MSDIAKSNFKSEKWRYFIDLVFQNARAGLKAEASRGYLGVLWWVIEPVMYMGVFYFAFKHLMHRGDENYIMFLLIGLIVWKWFQATVNTGAVSLIAHIGLMNQVYLPKIIFPLTNTVVNTFKFLIIFTILLSALLFSSINLSFSLLLIPVLILVQLLLIVAVTTLLAAVIPFFPDLRYIIENVMLMLFFVSGIIFDMNNLPESVQRYLQLNPMACLITMYRQLLLNGIQPEWKLLFYVVLFSFSVLILSIWILRRYDREYPKIIH